MEVNGGPDTATKIRWQQLKITVAKNPSVVPLFQQV